MKGAFAGCGWAGKAPIPIPASKEGTRLGSFTIDEVARCRCETAFEGDKSTHGLAGDRRQGIAILRPLAP
jgi:hypothetical protein